jgi:TnpA family transposase
LITARALSRYLVDEGLTTYTHVSDQHSTYGTKVVPSTVRDVTYVLDEILGNPTDLPIAEHVVDTSGQTLVLFGAFDLLGLRFSPRIRDLGGITLYRNDRRIEFLQRYPRAGGLLSQRIDVDTIHQHWDDLLRLAGSLKFGHATASIVIGRLHAGSRQNALAGALIEYGKLIRTIYALRYLADETYRRRINRQLNKGETIHALRRALFFAHEGHVRRRHLEQQTDQALCHTMLANSAITWNTEYFGLALSALAGEGHRIDEDLLAHVSPAQLDHINRFGTYTFDVEAEFKRPGYRPLRAPATE